MKKTLIALSLALGLSAATAEAQITLTADLTAKQQTNLTKDMTRSNKETCLSVGLAEGCTQSAARNAWIAKTNGAVCTSLGLGPACTETAARTQWCAMLGYQGTATCTHPDGRGSAQIVFVTSAPSIDIYSDLQNYWSRRAAKALLDDVDKRAEADAAAIVAAAEAAVKTSGTKAEKDAYCAAIKQPAGCIP